MFDQGRLELTLTLHGPETVDNSVDVELFSRKLTAFLKGIRQADKIVNGKRSNRLLLTEMRKASASISVREQALRIGPAPNSGMKYFADAVALVSHRDNETRSLPTSLLKTIALLNSGLGQTFSRGEFKSNQGLHIDLNADLARIAQDLVIQRAKFFLGNYGQTRFEGSAFASYDGTLKMVDLIGDRQKAVLVLTAGGKQIDCCVDALTVEQLRSVLDRRVMVSGRAHYRASAGVPDLLDVLKAVPLHDSSVSDLARWRGSFEFEAATIVGDAN